MPEHFCQIGLQQISFFFHACVFYSRVRRTTGLRNVRPLIGVTPVRSSAAELTGMPVSPSASSPHKKKEKEEKKDLLPQRQLRTRRTYSASTRDPAFPPDSSPLGNAVSHADARLAFCSGSPLCCRAVHGLAALHVAAAGVPLVGSLSISRPVLCPTAALAASGPEILRRPGRCTFPAV